MNHVPLSSITDVLGLPPEAGRSPIALLTQIEQGFSIGCLDTLADHVFPLDTTFRQLIVPRSTWARLKKTKDARLSPEISDVLYRIGRVWTLAREIWGSNDNARAFMERPHPLLDGRTPKDVIISTELGAQLVEDILGRLQHGSAA